MPPSISTAARTRSGNVDAVCRATDAPQECPTTTASGTPAWSKISITSWARRGMLKSDCGVTCDPEASPWPR